MAITNGYLTLAEARSWLELASGDSTASDSLIEECVEGASRMIDKFCNRRFYTAAETNYYSPEDPRMVFVDDLVSVTTLKTDDDVDGTFETSWTANTNYYLQPFNASRWGFPYTWIEISDLTVQYFPSTQRKGVELYGVFGFPSVPDDVKIAAYMLTARLFRRKMTPLGISGNPQVGIVRVEDDPDIVDMLKPLQRNVLPEG